MVIQTLHTERHYIVYMYLYIVNLLEQNRKNLCIQIKKGGGQAVAKTVSVSRTRGLYFFILLIRLQGSFTFKWITVIPVLCSGVTWHWSILHPSLVKCLNVLYELFRVKSASLDLRTHTHPHTPPPLTLTGMQVTGGKVKACLNTEIAQDGYFILTFQPYSKNAC